MDSLSSTHPAIKSRSLPFVVIPSAEATKPKKRVFCTLVTLSIADKIRGMFQQQATAAGLFHFFEEHGVELGNVCGLFRRISCNVRLHMRLPELGPIA